MQAEKIVFVDTQQRSCESRDKSTEKFTRWQLLLRMWGGVFETLSLTALETVALAYHVNIASSQPIIAVTKYPLCSRVSMRTSLRLELVDAGMTVCRRSYLQGEHGEQ